MPTMALFLALFAIVLHNTAANYLNDSTDPGLAQKEIFTAAELAQHDALEKAASLIQYYRDVAIAAVVPVVEISNGTRDLSKDYNCTMHMKNTGISHHFNSSERMVSRWNGTKQLCPQPNNPHTNFHCENAVFLVNETSWEKSESGIILYDLSDVRGVDLVGHDTYENYFDALNLTARSSISGGRSFNIYSINYADANTVIYLNSASNREFIDLSNALQFQYASISFNGTNDGSIHGLLAFDSSAPARLEWTDDFKRQDSNSTRDWQILGRQNMPDTIQCSNDKMMAVLESKIQINAYGLGGNEETNDVIIDCMESTLNPFTKYVYTYSNERYFLAANLGSSSSSPDSKRTYSTIELNENDIVITFDSENYLERVLSMKYLPWNNTLTLEIMWTNDTVMVLNVRGILRKRTRNQFPNSNLSIDDQSWDGLALFMMDESSMYHSIPTVEKPAEFDNNTVIDVTTFLIVKAIDGTSLDDVKKAYEDTYALRDDKWNFAVALSLMPGEGVFYFGSPVSDNVRIFGSLRYIRAENGMDSFQLVEMSRKATWIDNEASDGVVDRLQINSDVCKHLEVGKQRKIDRSLPSSVFNVVIKCKKHRSESSKKLILMDYLKDESSRHLTILRDNRNYVILPRNWISSGNGFSLLEIIDFQSPNAVNRSVSKPDNFWILMDEFDLSEITYRRIDSNVFLCFEWINLSIELENFYDAWGGVSEEWGEKFFAISNDLSNDSPKIFRAMDIHKALKKTNMLFRFSKTTV